jgi:hypothetical protein
MCTTGSAALTARENANEKIETWKQLPKSIDCVGQYFERIDVFAQHIAAKAHEGQKIIAELLRLQCGNLVFPKHLAIIWRIQSYVRQPSLMGFEAFQKLIATPELPI